MQLFFVILHVFLSIILILIILLQPGKDSADIFGGGSGGGNKMYGNRSQQSPIGKATTFIAVLFMVTSITLALYSSKRAQAQSELDDIIKELQKELTDKDIERKAQKLPTVLSIDSDDLNVIDYQLDVNERIAINTFEQKWTSTLQSKAQKSECRSKCKSYQANEDPDNFDRAYWDAAVEEHSECVAAIGQQESGEASAELESTLRDCLPKMYQTCANKCFEGEQNAPEDTQEEEQPNTPTPDNNGEQPK